MCGRRHSREGEEESVCVRVTEKAVTPSTQNLEELSFLTFGAKAQAKDGHVSERTRTVKQHFLFFFSTLRCVVDPETSAASFTMAQPFSAPPEMLATLSQIFTNTLNPATQKQAEATLTDLERQPNARLPLLLLALIAAVDQYPTPVRLAASIKLKNICRRAWASEEALEAVEDQGVELVTPEDCGQLKASLLPLLTDLSQPTRIAASPAGLRLQLSEAVALIAASDFPAEWPTLIDDLTSSLASPPDSSALQSVLQTTHSIFRGWRSAFRTNELYTEINLVLDKFASPFLELVKVSLPSLCVCSID